jgi:hypothetical protein
MDEEKIIITISEDGKIQADAIGFKGEICEKELEKLLEGFPEIEKDDKKSDYYNSNIQQKYITKHK